MSTRMTVALISKRFAIASAHAADDATGAGTDEGGHAPILPRPAAPR